MLAGTPLAKASHVTKSSSSVLEDYTGWEFCDSLNCDSLKAMSIKIYNELCAVGQAYPMGSGRPLKVFEQSSKPSEIIF